MNLAEFMKDPRGNIMKMAKNNSNPILQNMINLAEKGDVKGVENIAINMFNERGQDFIKETSEIRKMFK